MESIKDKIKTELLKYIAADMIILFGSFSKHQMNDDSDIDIAFLSKDEIHGYDLFMIAQKLADLLGRDVDLVDLGKASTVFAVQIIAYGVVLYDNDWYANAVFKMRTYKKYALLNEERQCILDKIKERGSIYAR